MKRYVRRMSTVVDKSILSFCAYLFRLLVNCLDSISIYFKLICQVFLLKYKTQDVIESLNALQDGISTRHIDKKDIKRMVSLHLKQKNIQKPISAAAETTNIEISKKSKNKNNKKDSTILDKSPFTQNFKDIKRDVSMDIKDKFESESLSEENEF